MNTTNEETKKKAEVEMKKERGQGRRLQVTRWRTGTELKIVQEMPMSMRID